jgi:L-amino acid N-acyltransferase YncA
VSQSATEPTETTETTETTAVAVSVRDATPADLPAMAGIYDEQVRTSVATFDTEERGTAYLTEKLASAGASLSAGTGAGNEGNLVLVAAADERVLGYACSGPFRPRPAYAGTKEVSVYLEGAARGRGVGRLLYTELLTRLDASPAVHTQVAVIALPNDSSEALHRRLGFERVGVLREVGHKFGRYVDTAWYQRTVRRTDSDNP